MRKIAVILTVFVLFISCASKNKVIISELTNDLDILVTTSSEDSMLLFVPRVIQIQNNSAQSLRVYDIRYNHPKFSPTNYILVFDEDDSIRLLPPDKVFVAAFSKKYFSIFTAGGYYPKSKLDTTRYKHKRLREITLNVKSGENNELIDSLKNTQSNYSLDFNLQTKNRKKEYFITYHFKDSTTTAMDLNELKEMNRKQRPQFDE